MVVEDQVCHRVESGPICAGPANSKSDPSGHGDREMLDSNVQVSYVAGDGREQCKWIVARFWLLVPSPQ